MFYVYILKTNLDTLYIGQTNNLEKRIAEHKAHKTRSAKYLRYFTSFELVYSEELPTRSAALKREIQLKKFTRAQKNALIRATTKRLSSQV